MTDCYQDHMLNLDQAQQHILNAIHPITDTHTVPLDRALARVLAEPVSANVPVPPFRNSAMDGYAIFCDEKLEVGQMFDVVGESFAGAPFTGELHTGQAVRIMTGAVMPEQANTVIMQEHIERKNDVAITTQTVTPNQNVRHAGEDVQQGDVVFDAGRKLSAIDLGVLASMGCAQVRVYRRVKVAVFCTGDELKAPNETLQAGEIYNSNRFMLNATLKELGANVLDLGVIEDKPEALEKILLEICEKVDVIISTGGVSVGDADYVKPVMQKIGKISFWKVAIKPGKPFAFGKIHQCDFYGLPGNPVSSAVTFELLVKHALQKTSGQVVTPHLKVNAVLETNIKKRAGRMDFQRGVFSQNKNGDLTVRLAGGQGSHQLFSLANADGLICLPKDSTGANAGERVEVWLLKA